MVPVIGAVAPLIWVVGIGVSALLGLAASYGLSEAALEVFDGLVAFACWMFSHLADVFVIAFTTLFGVLPGGWVSRSAAVTWGGYFGYFAEWVPILEIVGALSSFLFFVAVWIPTRTLLRLLPWVG